MRTLRLFDSSILSGASYPRLITRPRKPLAYASGFSFLAPAIMAAMPSPTRQSKPIAVAIAALSVDLAAASAPTDFRVIPAGEFRAWDGRPSECPAWVCTEDDGRRIVAELAARTRKSVIDYEHATLKAKREAVKAPAAGWFERAEWRSDGLWLIGVDWTALAAREIADKAYRYISPVFSYDSASGRVRSLLHAALTNEPGLDNLTDLAALAAHVFLDQPNQEEVQMELLKKLLAALGLQETATETEALSAVAALKTNVASLTAQVTAPDPTKFAPIATLSALQGENADLQTKVAALQAEIDGGKLDTLIDEAKAAGKITPATEPLMREIGKKDFAALSALLDASTPVVKPGGTQTGGKGPEGGTTAALSAEQKQVVAALGLTVDQFNKANKANPEA